MKQVRIFIADDHPIVRNGIKSIFSSNSSYTVVGEADDGLKALQGVSIHRPDIVILDITMPELDGILVTERIAREYPDTKVIILSMHQDRQYAVDAFRAGARAYILKGGDADEILLAVKKVMAGLIYASPPLADEIMIDFVDIIKGEQSPDPFGSLSLREREVLKLIAEGNTNRQVAEKLFLSVSTIKSYRVNIMKKLKVNDTAGLVKAAVLNKLVRLE